MPSFRSYRVAFCTRSSRSDRMPALVQSPIAGEEGQSTRIEWLWQKFLSDPSQWWDNRFDKPNSKYPCFRHKTTKEALWTDNRFKPPWLQAKLASMGEDTEEQSFPSTCECSGQAMKIEQLWLEFFPEPLQCWDNRFDKKKSNYPDFKRKATEEALWVNNRFTPPWVQARLVAIARDDGEQSVSSMSKIFGDADRLEQLWQGFFSDPLQWWDNSSTKE